MTITTTLRTATGARTDLSPKFHVDHARRLVGFDKHGKRVNPEELRRARKLLRLVQEAA